MTLRLVSIERLLRAERVFRRKSDRSVFQVAEEMGISYQRVYQLLKGHRPLSDADITRLESKAEILRSRRESDLKRPKPRGYVYFITTLSAKGPIKIGSAAIPEKRLSQLMKWSPYPLQIMGFVRGDYRDEYFLHRCLAPYHSHGEWFHNTPEVLHLISNVIRLGISRARKTIADPTRCTAIKVGGSPCGQRRGHGPKGDLCLRHAFLLQKRNAA